ncbi:transcription-associated protein Nipped-A isoform X2 [Lycorma delicatula]|uniref:transcription-associated protein Nipped-A isoform X2 n=1 Tax=Lycorma delicatula TaxID=130591 RepID=UPI003F511E2D
MTPTPPAGSMDPAQFNTYRTYLNLLADTNYLSGTKEENKLQAAQEISDNLDSIVTTPQYPSFLEHMVKVVLKVLKEGTPSFIAEHTPHIQNFLQFVRAIYKGLPEHMNKIFEPKAPIRINSLTELDFDNLLNEIYTSTSIQVEPKVQPDGSSATEAVCEKYTLIPKGILSLKVLQELPIIVVLMYQLYKANVEKEVKDYIPIIIHTITLQPAQHYRINPAFNKEVFVDFMGAQIKTLSFLAYIIRIYQEEVGKHSSLMAEGMLGMLQLCPMEVTHLRKDLFIAARHILATELRINFVPYVNRLFDEDILLGRGWTTHESLRPLAYSTLGDLVHHVRMHLPMSDLAKAVHLFSMNVHDETLPTSIQVISCKLLLNLVDCIQQRSKSEAASGSGTATHSGQELLMRMLEVFIVKFKTVAKLQLPVLVQKCKAQQSSTVQTSGGVPSGTTGPLGIDKAEEKPIVNPQTGLLEPISGIKNDDREPGKVKFGFPTSQAANYSVADCRLLVKTLVCGVKNITWRCASFKNSGGIKEPGRKLFQPKETEMFIRLVKWAMQALDIYMLSVPMPSAQPAGQRTAPQQTVRTKEEREVLEHFSGVFSVMDPQTFHEIFSTTIEYIVERFAQNFALQVVGNSFLTNNVTSPIFATVLVEYLLGRMEEMGNGNVERSNLYLKLFNKVFGSVSLFAAKNEHMLKPHLHQIVNRSMELAMTAKEPYNYFLLLRALFRSIGGGNHDLLYQEFFSLLPNLLQGLNSLQSGLHKQHMKDLFVELCLTVPVRLSSLLPYLHMLMDPLVSALNGSHTLISQGLRTLELCVDNLQPDFLYEHIQPVRADLMQALWRSLRNPTDQVAHVAFRVLGKFGGGNRKMMIEPQKLDYSTRESPGPAVVVYFPDHTKAIDFSVEKVIETSVSALKFSTTDPFHRRQCWEAIESFLMASVKLDDDRHTVQKLFSHPSFKEGKINHILGPPYKLADKQSRQTYLTALTGMFVGAAIKDLHHLVQPTMVAIVRHFTMVAIAQQAGPFSLNGKQSTLEGAMDALVLIDALAVIMGHEEKELCKPGRLALCVILQTATTILGSKERACQLPLMEYLAERMCSLCYDRAWYAKLGGCIAIEFLYERMSLSWIYQHLFVFVKAQLFVMMDLTGEVSSGAIDKAKSNLENMMQLCRPVDPENTELATVQKKALTEVTYELIRQITSPTDLLREQSVHLLKVFAEAQGKSVTEVMEPHKEVLVDMIPPKKHLPRHQTASAQIGLLEGHTFCTSLTPRLFTIDLTAYDHDVFFREVISLCDAQDAALLKLPCYKNIGSLTPLRKAAMRALAACHYVPGCTDKIFPTLYKALERPDPELQEAAFECMKTFVSGSNVDMTKVLEVMRPLLSELGDYRNLSLSSARCLSYLVQLFPSSFKEKLCKQLLQFLEKLLENMMQAQKGVSKNGETERIIATIINIFHQIPAAGPRFIDMLCSLVLQTERALLVGPTSPFREPLLRFLLQYPDNTMDLFLSDTNIKDEQWSRYLEYLIKHQDGKPFRDVLQNEANVQRLIVMALAVSSNSGDERSYELQYQSIRIVSLLVKLDDQWLSTQHQLVATYRQIWCNDQYQERHKKVDNIEYPHWKEPKLLVKILLHYFSHHPPNIDLLFQLLRAFCDRLLPDFQFLRDFLENTVAGGFNVEWKRSAFFRFVELFPTNTISQELKAKILQLIVIPCFAVSFERGEGEKLIGGPANKTCQDSPDNIISVFINKIIDTENPFGSGDCVRILVLQLSCLLVEQALPHIHDTTNKSQGNNLRRLMTYAWPCLRANNCVDPATRYHGHLLLSHIIAKFSMPPDPYRRILLQVFQSLLKAHAVEVRPVVRQALDILTPAIPNRVEDGNKLLVTWTKKIIVEEGYSMQQLFHILQLVVRHYKVYYHVRQQMVQHMVNSIQRLGFSASATIEHRKLAVELAEVIIKWELQRIKEESDAAEANASLSSGDSGLKRSDGSPQSQQWKRMAVAGPSGSPTIAKVTKHDPDVNKPIEQQYADSIINFLARLACQVNEVSPSATAGVGSPGEMLSRRCVQLIRTALKPDVWPQQMVDLRLFWLDKVFASVDSPKPNLGNICTALELFTFLLTVMKREQVLVTIKPLQRGIVACISSSNTKVIRLTHALLSRLMSIFPTEPSSSPVASKHEELECLYSNVGKVIFEGLANYEKTATAASASLFGTMMMLKAACVSNPGYVDRLIMPFIRVIQRMTREHINPSSEAAPGSSELLILSLDLVKNRVGIMNVETRKAFIGTILVTLIEKTQDMKIMKAICKMLEEWMKNAKNETGANSNSQMTVAPNLREKSILLVKMMQYVEKRFPDLNTQFLELVNYVYRDENLKTSELTVKLEPAFLAGLRCSNPQIRTKFFEIFDGSMRRKLHDRLMYISSSQNWESMGQHYWLKQSIELILVTAVSSYQIQLSQDSALLPSISSVINLADPADKDKFVVYATIKDEPTEFDQSIIEPNQEDLDLELGETTKVEDESTNCKAALSQLIAHQAKFLEKSREVKVSRFLQATAQLCHMDTPLAERVWLDMFPRLWSILSERQQTVLTGELIPFLASGSHVVQKDIHPSAVSTFFEALSHCNPPLPIKSHAMKYLGKAHNLWHQVTLRLEQMVAENASQTAASKNKREQSGADCYDFEPEPAPQQTLIDHLAEMYKELHEEDMWCALWQKQAKYRETSIALSYEQQGFFEKALETYDLVITKARQEFLNSSAPINIMSEERLWERQWIRCVKELNQWGDLLEFAKTKGVTNAFLILESAWRVPDWNLMKEALTKVDASYPNEMAWKVNLYRGFLTICHPDDQQRHNLTDVERFVKMASGLCMREWRRLPHIVSHIHLPLLQAAQQIMELQEAFQIHQGLVHEQSNSLHDMKTIVKTWRNRLPVIADDLSHWSDVFTWRQHHYQFILSHYDSHDKPNHNIMGAQQASAANVSQHASAQAIIHFGKIARKQNLTGVCLSTLTRIYTITGVLIGDLFQTIKQTIKCYLQMANSPGSSGNELQQALQVVEETNLKFFNKEMTSEFYAHKGMLLAQIGRIEDAHKTFSAAVQMHDTLVKAWAMWGDFLEQQFIKSNPPNIVTGVSAITCFLHACRHQNESKSRKYLAKVLWLLTYDDDKFSLTEAVDKYVVGVPPIQWLPWIPQLLTCLVRSQGKLILNLLSQVGRMYPQAVYFPIRTLYLTLKIEQRERDMTADLAAAMAGKQSQNQASASSVTDPQQRVAGTTASGASVQQDTGTIKAKATPSMWRCCRIMHVQKCIHPTVLFSLEGIVDQMEWFRENWYEEVLRQLRQGLAKCYMIAFKNRGAVTDATITPHTLHFVKKLGSTFGIGIENITNPVNSKVSSSASESLARRAQVTIQDPVFQRMKAQFSADFDFTIPGATKLHNLIHKLKKWVKILEAKTKLLPKSFLIEEKCRFLSNFSLQTAEVELPGEFLLPKHSNYYVRISRFMPRVEVVQKHNTAARRLFIRGHNGKIYPYLVVNDFGFGDARREERVLQLLRMLNHYLGKQKETSRRFLHFTVPRVVAVSRQMRLVEDNPASTSLLDIYRAGCSSLSIEHDAPISRYYERLAAVQARGSQAGHQVLKDILKDIQNTMIPRTMLRDWAVKTYPSATDYWTFRKMLTLQLALACFSEYVLHLTRLNPDMMYIHQDSGFMNISYFKFDIDDTTGELDANRPVPFRLTPNLLELLTDAGVAGPLSASIIATARCFIQPNFKVQTILRTILKDEMIASHKKKQDEQQENLNKPPEDVPGELIITMVTRAVNAITQRLNSLANFEGTDSKVVALVMAARSSDNLCRMDPAWHPWL